MSLSNVLPSWIGAIRTPDLDKGLITPQEFIDHMKANDVPDSVINNWTYRFEYLDVPYNVVLSKKDRKRVFNDE
ncbi:MAG: hypothetical protein GTN99_02765 [Candidatus Dadabacteria bacterium]|nr:hypothetical protein [Candidatus Dadabacteria bacterium]